MSLRVCLFAVTLLVSFATSVLAESYRKWSDITGRFSVQARLVTIEGNTIILEREDGVKLAIEKSKLSPQDQAYLLEVTTTNPFKVLGEGPEGKPRDTTTPAPTVDEAPSAKPSVSDHSVTDFQPYFIQRSGPVVINWLEVKPVSITPGLGWELTVPKTEPMTLRAKTLGLPPKTDVFERVSALVVNPAVKRAVVLYSANRPGSRARTDKVVVCDLDSGTVGVGVRTDAEVPLAIYPASSPNDRFPLFRRDDFGFGNQDRLVIYSIVPARGGVEGDLDSLIQLMRRFIWFPYETGTGAARDVKWASFPDERTLITCSGHGLILVWDLANMKPMASLQTVMGQIPALSPDRRWLAFATKDQIGILDIKKREVIALQNTPQPQSFPILAFSPSGQKLACLANHQTIRIWDTASGKLEADFTLPSGMVFQQKFLFPHDDFILGGDRYLIHWRSQILVWEYDNLEAVASLGDLTCAVTTQKQRGIGSGVLGLVVAHIPHAAAQQVLDQALTKPETFAFRKGVPVKIDVSGIPEDAREKVTEILTERLEQMECDIQDQARITLAAGVSGPKERTVSYIHSGDYKVKEYQLWVKILADDQVLWETSAGGVPFILFLRSGENVGQKLKELTAKPNYDWFKTVVLPQYLQHVPVKGSIALGRGPLTIDE